MPPPPITASLSPSGDGTKVTVVSEDRHPMGKVAQFGRGVLADVSGKLLDQFVRNLETTVLTPGAQTPAAGDDSHAGESTSTGPTATGPTATGRPEAASDPRRRDALQHERPSRLAEAAEAASSHASEAGTPEAEDRTRAAQATASAPAPPATARPPPPARRRPRATAHPPPTTARRLTTARPPASGWPAWPPAANMRLIQLLAAAGPRSRTAEASVESSQLRLSPSISSELQVPPSQSGWSHSGALPDPLRAHPDRHLRHEASQVLIYGRSRRAQPDHRAARPPAPRYLRSGRA